MNSSTPFPGSWRTSAPAQVIEGLRLKPSGHLENGEFADVVVTGGQSLRAERRDGNAEVTEREYLAREKRWKVPCRRTRFCTPGESCNA